MGQSYKIISYSIGILSLIDQGYEIVFYLWGPF